MGVTATKELKQLERYALKQYPDLKKIKESMLVTDARQLDNPIIYANVDFEKLTLYAKEEIIGRNCRFLQGAQTSQEKVQEIRDALKTGERKMIEILNYRKDGIPFWNKFEIMGLRADPKDKTLITHYIGIQHDITIIKNTLGNPKQWRCEEVAMWADRKGMIDYSSLFIKHNITGAQLCKMGVKQIRETLGLDKSSAKLMDKHIRNLKKRKVTDLAKQQRYVIKTRYRASTAMTFCLQSDSLISFLNRTKSFFPQHAIVPEDLKLVAVVRTEANTVYKVDTDEEFDTILRNMQAGIVFEFNLKSRLDDMKLETVSTNDVGVALVNTAGKIVYANNVLANLTDYKLCDLIGNPFSKISDMELEKTDSIKDEPTELKTASDYSHCIKASCTWVPKRNLYLWTAYLDDFQDILLSLNGTPVKAKHNKLLNTGGSGKNSVSIRKKKRKRLSSRKNK